MVGVELVKVRKFTIRSVIDPFLANSQHYFLTGP